MPGTFSVPERKPLLVAAAVEQRRQADARVSLADVEDARALGAVELVARDSESRSMPSASTSTGILPTACVASEWKMTPRSRQSAADLADRLERADLVVRPHDRDEDRVRARSRAGDLLDARRGPCDRARAT